MAFFRGWRQPPWKQEKVGRCWGEFRFGFLSLNRQERVCRLWLLWWCHYYSELLGLMIIIIISFLLFWLWCCHYYWYTVYINIHYSNIHYVNKDILWQLKQRCRWAHPCLVHPWRGKACCAKRVLREPVRLRRRPHCDLSVESPCWLVWDPTQYGFVWKCWVNIPNEIAI